MYLAPLNYDRFFKKVFSDPLTAKAFLEDFFETTIEHIEILPLKHKVTDAAASVEFDYRCLMDGQPVIIDMQQWWKGDLVKRFYVYHALSTALQLEGLAVKAVPVVVKGGKPRRTRNYEGVAPVITLLWMVDDTLGFKEEDYVGYALAPEQVAEFVRDGLLWEDADLKQVLVEREKVPAALDNKTKSLDFLPQNRLIYAFQKNIVENKKYTKYFAWFDFAEKTKNRNNKKQDFSQYAKEEKFARIIERLSNEALDSEELNYIYENDQFWEQAKLWETGVRREAKSEGRAEGFAEAEAKAAEKIYQGKLETARVLKQNGVPFELIMQATQLSREEIEGL